MPLPRSAFSAPDFDPLTFLDSSATQHKSLDDLRTELRELSAAVHQEFLDYVDQNYGTFLRLGPELEAGQEKVDRLRMDLLSFRRQVEATKTKVRNQHTHLTQFVTAQREEHRRNMNETMTLSINRQVVVLRRKLMLQPVANADESDHEEETEDSQTLSSIKHAELYLQLTRSLRRVKQDQPPDADLAHRVAEIRSTVLLDLTNALKDCLGKHEDQASVLGLLAMFSQLDATSDAMRVLNATRKSRSTRSK